MKITVELTVGVDGSAVSPDDVNQVAEGVVQAIKLTLPQRWNSITRTLIVEDIEMKEAAP